MCIFDAAGDLRFVQRRFIGRRDSVSALQKRSNVMSVGASASSGSIAESASSWNYTRLRQRFEAGELYLMCMARVLTFFVPGEERLR